MYERDASENHLVQYRDGTMLNDMGFKVKLTWKSPLLSEIDHAQAKEDLSIANTRFQLVCLVAIAMTPNQTCSYMSNA